MYNGQKTKNEGQTICTRHTYVQWVCLVHIVCPSFFIFWPLYIGMPCTYCLSFVLYLLTIVHRYAWQRTKDKQYVQGIPMYNGQKIKNKGQTICTRHAYVQWSEDKERRTDNMYKAYLCIVCPSFFAFWSLYIGMPCTYCLSFVLYLLTIVHRYALYILSVLRSLSSRRTNNMYKAYLCTMIRRQRTKDKQYVQGIPMYNGQKIQNEGQTHRYALYILFVLRSLSSDHCT
jgi:hypothetical protein